MQRALFFLFLLVWPVLGQAQTAAQTQLATGHKLYLARNYQGALAAYNEVKQKEPANAGAQYYAACALVALAKYSDAAALLTSAAPVAAKSPNASLQAKILFVLATVKERQGDLAAASAAWNDYLKFAKDHGKAVTFSASAEARLKAISKKVDLDGKYQIVRQRIAANK